METEQSPSLDALAKLGFVKVNRPIIMLNTRPRHAAQVATGWHAGIAFGLLGLCVAAFVGWWYHEKSGKWPND